MFSQPLSMAMRAALASLLGSLFGIGLIVLSNQAQAQPEEASTPAPVMATAAADTVAVIRRIGDATLRSLRGTEPAIRGLRIQDAGSEAGSGLRWQAAQRRILRSEIENPRNNDQLSLGLQLSF